MEPLNDAIRTYVVNEYVQDVDVVIEDTRPLISGGIADSFSTVSLRRFLLRTCQVAIPDKMTTPDAVDTSEQIAALVRRIKAEA